MLTEVFLNVLLEKEMRKHNPMLPFKHFPVPPGHSVHRSCPPAVETPELVQQFGLRSSTSFFLCITWLYKPSL